MFQVKDAVSFRQSWLIVTLHTNQLTHRHFIPFVNFILEEKKC